MSNDRYFDHPKEGERNFWIESGPLATRDNGRETIDKPARCPTAILCKTTAIPAENSFDRLQKSVIASKLQTSAQANTANIRLGLTQSKDITHAPG
jgi:hypothetical protein